MKKKTLQERWNEETLSDNTQTENCQQCKSCKYQSDGTVWSNHYTKSACQRFPYPKMKPVGVMDNLMTCPYYELS